jgi:hypothetical protein
MARYSAWAAAAFGLLLASPAWAGVSYFLVAERDGSKVHGDSFVVGLSEPDHIAHARDLIARGADEAGAPILFAHIAPGADGLNRDLLSPTQREWNWHIDEVAGFGDFGIELIDGWPTFVESDVPGWIDNTNGDIGFWSYTVVQELPNYPSQSPSVPLPPAAWAGAATMGLIGVRRWLRKAE